MPLTDRKVQALKCGEKVAEPVPGGRLVARRRASGTREYYFRARSGGRDVVRKLGDERTLTLAQAREKARAMGATPAAVAATGTFGDLLDAYVKHLDDAKKASAADVRRTILRAVPKSAAIRRTRAASITGANLTDIIAARIRDGVTTEANRLRAHFSAAFAFGAKLDHDPRRPADVSRFGLSGNPASVVARIDEFERAGDRVLTWDELGDYWRALDPEPPVIKATLRFVLAIGGQRMQQVLRAEWSNIQSDATIELVDAKGKGKPRPHVVPIPALAMRELDTLRGHDRPFPVTHWTLADAITRARGRMKAEPFDARDLRRSVETHLSELKVGKETRAHLLSHGRTGVQERHYDRALHLPEKRAALELWCRHLAMAVRRSKRREQERQAAAAN